jgi:UDP-N-acetylglucosamine 1-carboxyvinyltransferase
VKFEDLWNDTLRVYRSENLKSVKIQTNIHPWFPTDLQSIFAILMTQSEWESRIHEVLYEWRLGWLVELEKMWANLKLINPHEAKIFGKTSFNWEYVTSWDLRAGCAVVIAWLLAEGTTHVTNIVYIKRWYENFLGNLQELWADIELV